MNSATATPHPLPGNSHGTQVGGGRRQPGQHPAAHTEGRAGGDTRPDQPTPHDHYDPAFTGSDAEGSGGRRDDGGAAWVNDWHEYEIQCFSTPPFVATWPSWHSTPPSTIGP